MKLAVVFVFLLSVLVTSSSDQDGSAVPLGAAEGDHCVQILDPQTLSATSSFSCYSTIEEANRFATQQDTLVAQQSASIVAPATVPCLNQWVFYADTLYRNRVASVIDNQTLFLAFTSVKSAERKCTIQGFRAYSLPSYQGQTVVIYDSYSTLSGVPWRSATQSLRYPWNQ